MNSIRKLLLLLFCAVWAGAASAQSISGTIFDDTNQPLPGATVVIEGTTKGSVTDLDGNFTIQNVAPGSYNLNISYIGYIKETVPVQVTAAGSEPVSLTMRPDAQILEDVVVVGYGVQRKREVTGAISQVKSKELTDIPAPSFEAALQGKASGVQVTQGSGLAGSASVIRVRGISSISAAGDPLYVVDGIPITQDYFLNGNRGAMNNNPLATINPNDIESVEILKDAAATGIYGSRGANGVILITTKRGRTKGTKFDFTSRIGTSQPTALPNMLNSSEFLQLYQEAHENDGGIGLAQLPGGISWDDARNTDTDWVDETVGLGFKQMYNLGVSRGWDKVNSYFSLGYEDNGTYLLGNSYERLSGRANIDYTISPRLKLSATLSASRGINNRVDAAWSGGLGAAMSTALPIYPIYWQEDQLDGNGNVINQAGDFWSAGSNPVRQRELTDWRTREWRFLNNIRMEYKPMDNLILAVNAGYDHLDLQEDKYSDPLLLNANRTQAQLGLAENWPTWANNWNANATATYLHDLSEDHKLTYLVGVEYQNSETGGYNRRFIQDSTINGTFYENDYLDRGQFTVIEDSEGNPIDTLNEDGYRNDGERLANRWNFISTFARVNYAYKNKYFLQATARVDGSSKFGDNYRYGFFPSLSGGWVLSDEDFMENNRIFSFLKLTAGVGIVGNANIPDYQQYGFYNVQQVSYNGQPIRFLAAPSNPDLRWETTRVLDAALEMGFAEDRITAKVGVYDKRTTDVLLQVTPQDNSGFDTFWDNLGEIRNQGVELEIGAQIIDRPNFGWRSDINGAYNYNEIVSIGSYTEDAISGGTNDTRVVVGDPVGANFLVRFSHIDPETGFPVYLDINGNPTTQWDPADRVSVGRVLPLVIGGWTNTFSIGKRWEVGLVMVYSLGSDIYDSSSKRQLGVVSDWNMRTDIFDRWRQPGDTDVEYARLTLRPENYGLDNPFNNNTTQFLHDGDYLRFRRLSVTYNIPGFKVGSVSFDRLAITATATNFATITNFVGLDPEIARDFENVNDRNLSPNITYLTPPQERSYNLSFTLNF